MYRQLRKGIKVEDLKVGTGDVAEKGKILVIHYECFLPRGEICGTSRDKPHPVQFELGAREMPPAIEYGVVGMRVAGLRSIKVSPNLTHYERKMKPDLPENAALRYEVELLHVDTGWDTGLWRTD